LDTLLSSFDVRTPAEARALTRRLFHKPPLPVMLFAGELKKFYGTTTVQALATEARATRESLTPDALRSLRMPVLLLWGGSERLLPAEMLEYYRSHLPPHARVQVVEGFGHIPQVERPEELVSHLLRFADGAGL
jgi:pimeloyl-ACP methyl ester carboxylesterase